MITTDYPADLVISSIPLDDIEPAPDNPRSDLGDLTGLRESIAENGVIEPLIVTPHGDGYRIVAGHRRYAALCEDEHETAPCIIREMTTIDRISVMAVENMQRADLTPLDEARAFQQLADLDLSQRAIAERVGVSQAHVSRRLKLGRLPDKARTLLERNVLTIRQAETLADLPDGDIDDVVALVNAPDTLDCTLPDWTVDQAIKKLATDRKHADALATGEASGLARLDRQPYKGAGTHEPCSRTQATHWYLASDGVAIIWAKQIKRTAPKPPNGSSTAAPAGPAVSREQYESARHIRNTLLGEWIADETMHDDLKRHGLGLLAEEMLGTDYDTYLSIDELRRLVGSDSVADLSDDHALLIACANLAGCADLDFDEDEVASTRDAFAALGYELQPWEGAPAATDEPIAQDEDPPAVVDAPEPEEWETTEWPDADEAGIATAVDTDGPEEADRAEIAHVMDGVEIPLELANAVHDLVESTPAVATTPPWSTYNQWKSVDGLCTTIGNVNGADKLLHALAYEAFNRDGDHGRTAVVGAIVSRLDEVMG